MVKTKTADDGSLLLFHDDSNELQHDPMLHRYNNGQDIDPTKDGAPFAILGADASHPLAARLTGDGRLVSASNSNPPNLTSSTAAIMQLSSRPQRTLNTAAQLSPHNDARRKYGPRAVFYHGGPGVVSISGWQNPQDHGALSGYWVHVADGPNSTTRYAHMDPATAIAAGTKVRDGDYLGDYADPTNGHSTGPHVHVGRVVNGKRVDPGDVSPVVEGSTPKGGGWQVISPHHKTPHNGHDWRFPTNSRTK
jgi:hypothetical protein